MDASGGREGDILSWSGGKDAAFALHERGDAVGGLLTTISEETGRSSMHGVRPALIAAQADALGLPVTFVTIPGDGTNEAYERVMREALTGAIRDGGESILFADVFLEDVRAYREELLEGVGVAGRWPLWGRDTSELMDTFVAAGFRAVIVVVDGDALSPAFLGREVTPDLLAMLPEAVDPCGEHGEFHTFVVDGPPFDQPIGLRVGRRITRQLNGSEYHYLDLIADP